MNKMTEFKGLGGMLNGFRDLVKEESSVTFIGTPGFCLPFATFLGYPIRDKKIAFVPNLKLDKARALIATEYGMELGNAASPDADVVVILGGMAMPKIGVAIEEAAALLGKIRYKRLIGVCFMGILEQTGWLNATVISFDCVMNTTIAGDISVK
jgi:hypothetical protein